MSKMRTPKMDVVRFKEQDVIVASGGNSLTISNVADANIGDISIKFNGKTYGQNGISLDLLDSALTSAGFTQGYFTHIFIENGGAKEIYGLIDEELNPMDPAESKWNGTYKYDPEFEFGMGGFKKQ